MRLLLVEDDQDLACNLQQALRQRGYAVDHCADGIDAAHLGVEEPYDLVILDLGLPGRSGLEILQEWRGRGLDLPVLILTARDAWHEKVAGFKAGADDYLGKPFHLEELLARIEALLRRRHGQVSPQLQVAGIRLDEDHQRVLLDGNDHKSLTGTEFKLLRYFMNHPDQVLSKSRLTEHIYEYDDERDSNVIEVYVRRLRDKIGAERIRTRRGQGYVFLSQPDAR